MRGEAEEQSQLAAGKRARARPTIALPQLDAAEEQAAGRGVRTFTILDYLYRLRIGANYEDAAVFIDGPTETHESVAVHTRLTYIASAMSLISELRVRRLIGDSRFRNWANDFISNNMPSGYNIALKARLGLF